MNSLSFFVVHILLSLVTLISKRRVDEWWQRHENAVIIRTNFQNKSCCCFTAFIPNIRNENFVTCKVCACLRFALADTMPMHERHNDCGNVLNSINITTFSFSLHYLVACFYLWRGSFNKSINPNDEIRVHNGAGKKLFVFIFCPRFFPVTSRQEAFQLFIFHFISALYVSFFACSHSFPLSLFLLPLIASVDLAQVRAILRSFFSFM